MGNNTNKKCQVRGHLTLFITIIVVGVTVVLALYDTIHREDSVLTTQTLIPLWATWIGTVLAFYYGKDNFDTATKSYSDMVEKMNPDEKLKKISITKAMIPLKEMQILDYEESLGKTIKELLEQEKNLSYNRYVFIDDKNRLKAIIHRRNFTQYITDKIGTETPEPLSILFKNFLHDCNLTKNQRWKGEPVFIAEDSNMLEAKNAIFLRQNNRDVFVTKNGNKEEEVIGLITDKNILKVMNE